MFIKKIDKNNLKTGKKYYTYRLCESYRIENKVHHRNILNIGRLESIRKEDFKLLSDRIEQKIKGITVLFLNVPQEVEKEAEFIYRRILHEKLLDSKIETAAPEVKEDQVKADIRKVDVNSIENEDSRTFGGEWLSKQMLDDCGLNGFLSQHMEDEETAKLTEAEIISRMVHPSSELETARWLENESSLGEVLGLHKMPGHRKLYEAARRLYEHRDEVESFLYQHFESKYPDRMRLCLYDLTNFYFEGRKETSELSQFGRSKEKRSDAKLISLALLTNGQGFIRHSKFYRGNISEPSTLQEVLSEMKEIGGNDVNLFESRPIAVMDAGMATQENLTALREKGFDYLCVSRSGLQAYSMEDASFKTAYDNRGNPIEISMVKSKDSEDDDLYLYVKSEMKGRKEQSMSDKLTTRFEQELENIKSSLSKKRGVKEESAVNRRIGRLQQKYPSISKRYAIALKADETGRVNELTYERSKAGKEFGVYFIRCSRKQLTDELVWEIYNILREIESTFRCLKTDLDIRPIYHQKDKNTEAHLFVGIVAYQLVHAIRQGLKKQDIHYSWRRIRNIMSSQTMVTTRMKLENRDSLILRSATRPNHEQARIYRTLNFKQTNPKMRKKAVVPHE